MRKGQRRCYKDNVTRPGVKWIGDVRKFLEDNYKAICNLAHYHCKRLRRLDIEEDFLE